MKKIILTGGGTAGHVTPNLALLPALREEDFEIHYIGSYNGIERRLIEAASIPYDGISSGKLRRYFDLKNFSDPLRVLKGYFEARKLMKKYKPDIVFSKGGFVAVPVVLAAKHYKVPVIIHESDMTPGLANKICIPAASKVCCNFPETLKYLPEDKAVLTGSPIREELLHGDRLAGLQYAHLSADRPVILIIGGNSICEILALRKPNILIPLSAAASRGDQILNANSFAKQGFSTVLEEEVLTADTLSQAIEETYKNRQQFIDKMSESHLNNAVKTIMGLIHDCTRS